MEIIAHLRHCSVESVFFEIPAFDGGRFPQSDEKPPPGWSRHTDAEWVNILSSAPLPAQGWKVHVTATPTSSAEVLDTCWKFCVENALSFKFLKSVEMVFLRSSKYGDRSASGKFVTIYPRTEDELTKVLIDLDPLLDGHTGPTILSDVRWRNGPLYIRYGGFVSRSMRTEYGDHVFAIEDAEGRLVPDQRRPGFHVPEWVTPPDIVRQAIAERSKGRLLDFPYRPVRALHFSNGGGVYVALDREQNEVLLKEGRPHAGLDGSGTDAVARLATEARAYETLASMREIPMILDHRIGHEHYFLAREFVRGDPLVEVGRKKNPLLRGGATPDEFRGYTEWVCDVTQRIEDALRQMHELGVIFGDLHPGNILVAEDGGLSFIDLEGSFGVGEDRPQLLGAPGYIAPDTFRGTEIDHYALAVLRLDLLVPLVRMTLWHVDKARDLIEFARRYFPLPDDFVDRVVRGLRLEVPRMQVGSVTNLQAALDELTSAPWPRRPDGPARHEEQDIDVERWLRTQSAVAEFIVSAATPERLDRLYPGDPQQFADEAGGVTFAHGAAGVLWALTECGVEIPDSHVAWLRKAASAQSWQRPGFGDGLAGIALTWGALGDVDAAASALGTARSLVDRWTGRSVHGGLAGIGLASLDLDRIAPGLGLGEIADQLTDQLLDQTPTPLDTRAHPGLLLGETGVALLLLRQYERTGDVDLLDRAVGCLLEDLATLERNPMHGAEITDRLPMLAGGSGGVALVADRLLRHRSVPELVSLRNRVRSAVTMPFTDEAGLFYGHAGLMTVIATLWADDQDAMRRHLLRHAYTMRLHSLGVQGAPATVGRFALRLSCDLATGSAGVLIALQAMVGTVRLPLL